MIAIQSGGYAQRTENRLENAVKIVYNSLKVFVWLHRI